MIIGLGNDICYCPRIAEGLQRFGQRFLHRIYTDDEQRHADRQTRQRTMRYAQMFAAKEACAKALGTGIAEGVFLRHIEILRKPSGQPYLKLHGKACETLDTLAQKIATEAQWQQFKTITHLTLSGDDSMANAVVILEIQQLP